MRVFLEEGMNEPLEETPEWIRAHEELSRLAKSRAAADAVEGRWLLLALRSRTHVHVGFAGFSEYIESLFGYKHRSTEEKLRVAAALEKLPESTRALSEGRVSWSALRELTRVMTAETEIEWLTAAHCRSIREIERLVSGRLPGDDPSTPVRPELEHHVLRFEVAGETLAAFREATAKLRRESGEKLDDDAVLLLMARHVLGGPVDEGRSSYQLAITVCDDCGRGFQQGHGELTKVGEEIVEMAKCDAQRIGCTRAKQGVPPSVRRAVMRRDHGRCVVPGCANATFLDVHHLELRVDGGDHGEDNLIALCGAHHRAQHRGLLLIEGRPSTGLHFRHADGSRYGNAVLPRAVDAHENAFAALRWMGFREKETRRALERVRATNRVTVDDTEQVLREALAVLTNEAA
jgi:hypothetical protein